MYSSGESSDDDEGQYSTVVELGATRSRVASAGNSGMGVGPSQLVNIGTVPENPVILLMNWLNQKPGASVSNDGSETVSFSPQPICVLSTIETTPSGLVRPTSRMVSLKTHYNGRYVFYTNHGSAKASQLRANPACSLLFQMPVPEDAAFGSRQIILQCTARELSMDEKRTHWRHLTPAAKLREYRAPRMSAEVSLGQVRQDASFNGPLDNVDEPPEFWGAFEVECTRYEYWEGGSTADRHAVDRIVYERTEGSGGGNSATWRTFRLAP
jgi:pyridoxamine 5'-phosphate oxidase